jgi:hypothetical protein
MFTDYCCCCCCCHISRNRAPDGRDVTGGWYDAGDNVKFNLPMAWSAGVIAWSLVDFKEVSSGYYNHLRLKAL